MLYGHSNDTPKTWRSFACLSLQALLSYGRQKKKDVGIRKTVISAGGAGVVISVGVYSLCSFHHRTIPSIINKLAFAHCQNNDGFVGCCFAGRSCVEFPETTFDFCADEVSCAVCRRQQLRSFSNAEENLEPDHLREKNRPLRISHAFGPSSMH